MVDVRSIRVRGGVISGGTTTDGARDDTASSSADDTASSSADDATSPPEAAPASSPAAAPSSPGARPGSDGPRSRLLPGTRGADAGEVVRNAARTEHGTTWTWSVLAATVLAGLAGSVLVAVAVRLGAEGRSGAAVLTWVGLALGVLPALVVALTRDATVAARWTALGTAALVTAVPVGLRTAAGPTTPDDLLRYAHLASLRAGGPLLSDRFPAVVGEQPGLPALTAAVGRVSGLTVWHSAVVVLVVAHVVAVVGARALVRALGFGERVAVLAAVLWSLGPAVLVATSRVDGTTLGLALLVWALAAVLQAAGAARPARRVAWTGTAVGLAAATAVSDLAAAWTLVGLTLLVGAVTVGVTAPPVAGATVRRAWWPAAAGVVAVTVVWSLLPPGRAVQGDLRALVAGHDRTWPTAGAEVPLAVAAAVVAIALAAWGVHRVRARFGESGPRLGLAVAALFPVSLLGLLAGPTTTLAVVVWPVVTAGLAPFVAAGALGVWDLGARRTRSAAPDRSVSSAVRRAQRDTRSAPVPRPGHVRPVDDDARPASRRDRRVPLPVAAAGAATAAVLVGLGSTVATAPSASEPLGPTLAAGPLSTTEVLAVADRVAALAGPDARFLASDPALGDVLATVTGATAVTSVPAAEVFDATPTGATQTDLVDARVGWLVDADGGDQTPLALTPWLVRVLTTPTVTVYRVRPPVPGAGTDDTASDSGVVPVATP